jgi:hypothetical protein
MNTIILLLVMAGGVAIIYKLLNHKDKTPDPLDQLEADANAKLAEAEKAAKAKMDEVLHVAETAQNFVNNSAKPENMSDAEWAMSNQNPNRVEVAPVVVTADTSATTTEAPVEAEPKAKKPRATKSKSAETADEKLKKPRAKKAK